MTGSIEVFRPKGEAGEAQVVSPEVSDVAVGWVALPLNSIVLAPGEVMEVPVIFDIPFNAEVGGYYLAVMWETAAGPNTNDNQVKISGRVGTLVLLRVNGEAKEELSIEDFTFAKGDGNYENLPVGFSIKLKNSGNVHLRPTGFVTIKNIFGKVSKVLLINNEEGNILPISNRRFQTFWQRSGFVPEAENFFESVRLEITQFAFGRFTAQATVNYSNEAKNIDSDELVFWVVPWHLLLVIFIVLLFLAVILVIFKRKKRNE